MNENRTAVVNAKVVIVETGVANIASMLSAFHRLGADSTLANEKSDIYDATHLVIPGVGTFAAAFRRLEELDLVELLRERILGGVPTLCVCAGMQILAESSDESPGVKGFGIIPGHVSRFPENVRIPQFGWNKVEANDDCRFLQTGYAYFANSYRLSKAPDGWHTALSEHGGSFIAALERDNLLACQFHPELSGPWGLALLKRWLTQAGHEPESK
ncbi:MAG: imidazole glycerol phosphate synthase subunit HisH [bacterium]|nr:imidazole glycerol phosphate synthase subunit HisH [bacterium]